MPLAFCLATRLERCRRLAVDGPLERGRTRLIVRGLGHRIMEAPHLRGIERRSIASPQPRQTVERWGSALLSCGVLASVLYVAMTLFVGLLWDGYSVASNVPSELAAIGAPTRTLWIILGTVYGVLMIAFGWIVWASAPPNRALRVVGALLMAHTVFGQFWPPMHQRAVLAAGGGTLTDTLHLVWAAVTGLFFMLIVGFGAAALGKRFRLYSIVTMVIPLLRMSRKSRSVGGTSSRDKRSRFSTRSTEPGSTFPYSTASMKARSCPASR